MGKRQCSGSADVSAPAVGGVLPPTLQEEADSPSCLTEERVVILNMGQRLPTCSPGSVRCVRAIVQNLIRRCVPLASVVARHSAV